jgi:hypothetical protein
MGTQPLLPRSIAYSSAAFVLVVALVGGADTAQAQDRSARAVFGISPVWATAFGGDAWEGTRGEVGLAGLAGLRLDGWRFALVASASDHDSRASLSPGVELHTVVGEVRRELRMPDAGLRVHFGGRAGLLHQEFDTSVLAVAEFSLVPGTEVSTEDTGLVFGPVAGASVPLAGAFGIEVVGAYQWADVQPLLLGPDEPEPGLSRAMTLSAVLTAGF